MNDTDVTVGGFLEHYGIKGMRWGVRRDNPSGKSGGSSKSKKAKPKTVKVPANKDRRKNIEKVDIVLPSGRVVKSVRNTSTNNARARSQDAVNKERIDSLIKEFGVSSLSSRDLQAYANRVELEARISRLTPPPPKNPVVDFLQKQGKEILVSEATTLIKSGGQNKGPILTVVSNAVGGKKKSESVAEVAEAIVKKKKS